jgi:hypothetical protein
MTRRSNSTRRSKSKRRQVGVRLTGGGVGVKSGGSGSVDVLQPLFDAEQLVYDVNACALPGSTIKYDSFVTILLRAMSRGYVRDHYGKFVLDGLRYGFEIGAVRSKLVGRRVFRNYKSAYEDIPSLTESIASRVSTGKTMVLGTWDVVRPAIDAVFQSYFVFPMGSVPKPHQPSVRRATSDHTKTGLNAATIMGILKHSLDTYNEVAYLLKRCAFMHVSDVADAFMLIPLAPWLWPFFLFLWCTPDSFGVEHAHVHLFGDFGTRGLPGTFRIFLVEAIVQMAKSEFVLTIPLAVYVDDVAMISEHLGAMTVEMINFQEWSAENCGILWKVLKDRLGDQVQLYIGFWWSSPTLTRTLDEKKVVSYLDEIAAAASAHKLDLKTRQSLAGKIQRAILTFPPGAACLIVNCYRQMSMLTLPWHTRRVSHDERSDYKFVHDLLQLNMGRGYYSYAGFSEGPEVCSDASKSSSLTAGGYLTSDGFGDYFKYGSAAARNPIDFLEGDTALRACVREGHKWYEMLIPFGIDNSAMQLSAANGRSKVDRLNDICRGLFATQIKYSFILQTYWISTHDNFLADSLSRLRIDLFWEQLKASSFLKVPFSDFYLYPDAGRTVTMEIHHRRDAMSTLRHLLDSYKTRPEPEGITNRQLMQRDEKSDSTIHPGMPNRGAGIGGDAQLLSISYPYATIYQGLPPQLIERLDEVMDNRLAPSSRSRVMTGYNRWKVFCDANAWDPLIKTHEDDRGGKLVAWVLSMVDDTDLVYASIETYVWGMRTYHTMNHQADPCFGLMHWREFMQSTAVLTAVPAEPRKAIPISVLEDILKGLGTSFVDVQFRLVLLILLFTFSRTESPCPKTFSSFSVEYHWCAGDFKLTGQPGSYVLWVRFKKIKQDARIERPSASNPPEWMPWSADSSDKMGRDWVPLGDVDHPLFSIASAFKDFVRSVGRTRDPLEPMFMAKDMRRPYTYACLRADLHNGLVDAGHDPSGYGPHGIRVEGYNLSKDGNGIDITALHGMWMSQAHTRYGRYSQEQVLSIPAGMLGIASNFATVRARTISLARTHRLSQEPVAPGPLSMEREPDVEHEEEILMVDDTLDDEEEAQVVVEQPTLTLVGHEARFQPLPALEAAGGGPPAGTRSHGLPPGYERVQITPMKPGGKPYPRVKGPDGALHRSGVQAWAHHDREIGPRPAVPPGVPRIPGPRVPPHSPSHPVPVLEEEDNTSVVDDSPAARGAALPVG